MWGNSPTSTVGPTKRPPGQQSNITAVRGWSQSERGRRHWVNLRVTVFRACVRGMFYSLAASHIPPMPKKRPSLRKDENETAYALVQAMTGEGPRPTPPGEGEKNPEAVARGSKGGKKGGRSRAKKLSSEDRKAIARRAAAARWKRPADPD
jgi:hypothetical protein